MHTPFEELPHVAALTKHFVLYDDGALGLIETISEERPRLSKPGRFLTEEQYQDRHLAWEVGVADRVDALQAEDAARTLGDYQALIDAGIVAATARRLSGYEGPEPDTVGESAE
ncbi:hypothetical protein ACFY20_44665 [Streptomyces sp. NPDC001312]|uniref:hypothetical protein n=1 Tax=Streptomyces sp. NPDC001312 TaxID=3364561 RepID=UPI003684F2AE